MCFWKLKTSSQTVKSHTAHPFYGLVCTFHLIHACFSTYQDEIILQAQESSFGTLCLDFTVYGKGAVEKHLKCVCGTLHPHLNSSGP